MSLERGSEEHRTRPKKVQSQERLRSPAETQNCEHPDFIFRLFSQMIASLKIVKTNSTNKYFHLFISFYTPFFFVFVKTKHLKVASEI